MATVPQNNDPSVAKGLNHLFFMFATWSITKLNIIFTYNEIRTDFFCNDTATFLSYRSKFSCKFHTLLSKFWGFCIPLVLKTAFRTSYEKVKTMA